MSPKPSPDSLIHCAVCGEDYSATYRRCPFCGAKNDPTPARAPAAPPPAARSHDEDDDGYVFDGQDLFDNEPEDDDYAAARPKGGKRLAEKSGGRFDLAAAPINWPRLITFICSLIIIVAALVIVFTVIYPQLSGGKDKDPNSTVSGAPDGEPSAPVAPPSAPVINNPVGTDPNPADSAEPSQPAVPTTALTGMRLNRDDFTLRPGESFKLEPTFTPGDWTGTVTWTSSDESFAKVGSDGTVTHVGVNVTTVHRVFVTASAGGIETQCTVYIAGPLNPSTPPVQSDPPQADPPAEPSLSSSGGVTVGRQGTIVNAEGGLRVRSGPGTNYEILATLLNGNTVNVISASEGNWYQISFTGSGGSTVTGYIMGDYISTN